MVESFFSAIKLEPGLDENRRELISPYQLQYEVAFWIENYYNRGRRQFTMSHLSPIDHAEQFNTPRTLLSVKPPRRFTE